MSWTDDQLDRLRTSLANAKRAGAWISAVDARIVIDLIQAYRRMTMRKGWAGPPDGRLPTVGQSRRHGVAALFVMCEQVGCNSRRRFTFDDLGLADDLVFVEIPRHRRFRCIKCGGRKVNIMADWPDPTAAHQRRMLDDDKR